MTRYLLVLLLLSMSGGALAGCDDDGGVEPPIDSGTPDEDAEVDAGDHDAGE